MWLLIPTQFRFYLFEWVSQVPLYIFLRALSPITPECPVAADAHFFTTDDRLHRLRQLGRTHLV
jgi:hypothetical protein